MLDNLIKKILDRLNLREYVEMSAFFYFWTKLLHYSASKQLFNLMSTIGVHQEFHLVTKFTVCKATFITGLNDY